MPSARLSYGPDPQETAASDFTTLTSVGYFVSLSGAALTVTIPNRVGYLPASVAATTSVTAAAAHGRTSHPLPARGPPEAGIHPVGKAVISSTRSRTRYGYFRQTAPRTPLGGVSCTWLLSVAWIRKQYLRTGSTGTVIVVLRCANR